MVTDANLDFMAAICNSFLAYPTGGNFRHSLDSPSCACVFDHVALLRIAASFRITSRQVLRIISVSKGTPSNEKAKKAKHQSSGSEAVE